MPCRQEGLSDPVKGQVLLYPKQEKENSMKVAA